MPEWLVENGIAESRAILVDGQDVLAARLEWEGDVRTGGIVAARLISRRAGTPGGTVRLENGDEALVDALPREASEGALIHCLITRAAMAETGRYKRAQARWTDRPLRPAPNFETALRQTGLPVRRVRRFPEDPWPDIIAEAMDGVIPFDGGAIVATPTPAMTLIDVDGTLPLAALALAAVPAIARAIGQLDLAGSIGIDFPSLERKEERRTVDQALALALEHWSHQSTAMNGFGFVQLVSRLERPSLLHRAQFAPRRAAAHHLLRAAEHVEEPGALLLCAHPDVHAATRREWDDLLARRTGRVIRRQADSALALGAGFAQAVPL